MSRVFISYAREDKSVIQLLAKGLSFAGHDVWWDADLGAADVFRESIESQLAIADVIIVVWSQRSRASRYVLDEAERAVARGILLPIRLDGSPPLGFGAFNALDFSGWGGDYNSDEWRHLLGAIAGIALVPMPVPVRLPLRVLRKALVVAATLGSLFGFAIWGLLFAGDSLAIQTVLGHPLVDCLALGLVTATPVAFLSAIETARAGFQKLSLIARRSLVWVAWSCGVALVILALATAAGVLDSSSPRGIASELSGGFVLVTAASAFGVTIARLAWLFIRDASGTRLG